MKPTFPETDLSLDSEALSNSDAARRALDYYLNPAPVTFGPDEPLLVARQGLSDAQATAHATNLLRCAAATACESADGLQGVPRDLALASMHMINMARAMLERTAANQDQA
ncbi:DUF3077 domain-containing protein [Pseudomonas]|jgi:hypothetical protein|uniref:DUF3077 domain-containing protein n=1 Tax=Pseudomonas wadenswilerensis TaxID=1785161 RepID=A0A380SZ97_9PSED|nr:DUF3077 domain-containing protein [Pseudomonas]MCE5984303.1 DUF3077 domain-containing protein [Pseudomonas sp. LF19]UVM19741.1 DUF3077 domain-containing protein [Pseudomonas wadenswilerensis]SPO69701.1 conserved protein of unknown function [Pseudomonas sp. JV241A]SUQ63362.1 hypothetical protein CCOS864_02812 [Pseudomonas wadenswilerensis]